MDTSSKSNVVVLLLLMALWAGSFTPGSHALQFENCLEDKLQAVDLHCEVDRQVREVIGLYPGESVDLHLGGVKNPLSVLTITIKADSQKVYAAAYLDLVGLPLSAKLKIVPEYCGFNNEGLSAQVYTSFFGFFTFSVNICLPPLPAN
ncbi:hypothetical protein M758_10G048500 [Ceratodon purpureus]|uniref:Uncharacterized protein n=1 Tax=Ceratodon purpureus TaxID=3225 RepID=A0A8T0GH35_CERPU|nr:hypothetical protein KC19_10G051800 [Ceratodon purpureus]KAG0602879.1 hypothetical protein M758_10G048500 [Ceratodon purpureus]